MASEADEAIDEGDAHDEGADEGIPGAFRAWREGLPLAREAQLLLGLLMPALLLIVNMWRVRAFTIDDSYISYRYARNLARGLGLVYNAGERVEGYTNFLWTVILAGGIRLGVDPDLLAKLLGALASLGSLALTFAISERLAPYRTLPCVATWLLASTIVTSGYAVFGLETALFVCLILAGTLLFLREVGPDFTAADRAFPWSGVVFALAGLTRPEAPMFLGILMLFLGRRIVGRQNLVRAALFAAPILAHLAFRRAYYGAWVPNTFGAKTGNLQGQLLGGWGYLQNYVGHAGAVVWLALLGAAIGVAKRRRDLLAIAAITLGVTGYVVLVGGDWMPFFRFMAPFEPFCFLLIDVGARSVVDRRERAPNLALAVFAIAMLLHRSASLREAQAHFLGKEKRFWDAAGGGTARWLNQNPRGEIAMGDIGYVGWATDYPILDLLGLVDPVISKLPGGYTQKLGPGFNERFFAKAPQYFLLISSTLDCQHPSVAGSIAIYRDRRFLPRYEVGGTVPVGDGFAWCIYRRKPDAPR